MHRSHHRWLERYMLDEVGSLDEGVKPSVGGWLGNVCRVANRLGWDLVDVGE